MEIRAIYEITAIVLIFLCAFILMIRFSNPLLRGIKWIAYAYAAGAAGIGLIALREHLPVFIGGIVANLLISLVNVFLYWGIQEILQTRKRLYWILPAAVIPTFIFLVYYTYIDNHLAQRIATYSIITSAGNILIAQLLLFHGPRRTSLPRTVLAILFLFWVFANYRRMMAAFHQQPVALFHELPGQSGAPALLLLVPLIELVMLGFGLIWLATAYLQLDLEELSRTDALTGLLNRRALEEAAVKQIALAREQHTALSLILIDLDHFKLVNDLHGHAGGDVALTMAANCLRQSLREFEFIARFGGEEFLIFLPQVSGQTAAQIAERLRVRLADLTVPYLDTEIRLSASFGVATFQPESDNWDDLLRRVDQALYQAKSDGRNCVAMV